MRQLTVIGVKNDRGNFIISFCTLHQHFMQGLSYIMLCIDSLCHMLYLNLFIIIIDETLKNVCL